MRLKSYSAKTHQGPYLQVNEDGYDFDFENHLFSIFDGFGGSGIGDKCVEMLKEDIREYFTMISQDANATMPFYFDSKNLLEGNALLNSLQHAHKKLLELNSHRPPGQRGSASLVVAAKTESLLILIGIGNCNAYLFRGGVLTKVLQEDSFKFQSRDRFDSPQVNFPMNSLGMYPEMVYQLREVRLTEGDKVILMTDGVYPYLSHEELGYAFQKHTVDESERINTLLKLSNSHGNLDNQTVMILSF